MARHIKLIDRLFCLNFKVQLAIIIENNSNNIKKLWNWKFVCRGSQSKLLIFRLNLKVSIDYQVFLYHEAVENSRVEQKSAKYKFGLYVPMPDHLRPNIANIIIILINGKMMIRTLKKVKSGRLRPFTERFDKIFWMEIGMKFLTFQYSTSTLVFNNFAKNIIQFFMNFTVIA